jgi:hypothetical protein
MFGGSQERDISDTTCRLQYKIGENHFYCESLDDV